VAGPLGWHRERTEHTGFPPIGAEKNESVRTHMEEKRTNMGARDDRYRRDHERWRAEHAEALAILRSAEARILAHEAQILAHEAALDTRLASSGSDSAFASGRGGSDTGFGKTHEAAAPHHHDLLRAIRALKPHLEGGPKA
jgi:hypothetical protein